MVTKTSGHSYVTSIEQTGFVSRFDVQSSLTFGFPHHFLKKVVSERRIRPTPMYFEIKFRIIP